MINRATLKTLKADVSSVSHSSQVRYPPSSPALLRRSGGKQQRALNIRTPFHDDFQHELSFKLNFILSFMYKSVIR